MPKLTKARAAELGRRGGRATVERYGREHMRAIGRRGFTVTVERHFAGDRRRAVNDLIQRGLAACDAHYPEALRKWHYDPANVPDRLPPTAPADDATDTLREGRAAYVCSTRATGQDDITHAPSVLCERLRRHNQRTYARASAPPLSRFSSSQTMSTH